jgi:hypothetical protein
LARGFADGRVQAAVTPPDRRHDIAGTELAETYFLFVREREGVLWASICSRSLPVREAREDLAALGLQAGPRKD